MNAFKPGDRVKYLYTWGDTGTVTKATKNVIRVQWDDTGLVTPVHPLELAHHTEGKEEGRSILRQESATALPTENPDEESVMTQFTATEQIQPPAGFREITEEGPFSGEYHGPEAHHNDIAVTSTWNKLSGINFSIYSTVDGHPDFNREELEELPGLIEAVLTTIDDDAALELLKSQTHLLQPTTTVNQLYMFAQDNKIPASAVFAAYEILSKNPWADNA